MPAVLVMNKGKSYGWMRKGYNGVLGKLGAERGHEWAEKILLAMIFTGVAGIGMIVDTFRKRMGGKEQKDKDETETGE